MVSLIPPSQKTSRWQVREESCELLVISIRSDLVLVLSFNVQQKTVFPDFQGEQSYLSVTVIVGVTSVLDVRDTNMVLMREMMLKVSRLCACEVYVCGLYGASAMLG